MNIQIAKQIQIIDYLESIGISPVKRYPGACWYLSPLRKETDPSFKVDINKNVWFDFGAGTGGNIIDLVKLITGGSTREAVITIEKRSFSFDPKKFKYAGSTGHIKILEVRPIKSEALINYLLDRSISLKFASKYLHEATFSLYSKNFFALAWRNDHGGYELRNRLFKGCSSPKWFTTIRGSKPSTVNLFEGFTDFLSCCTYYKKFPLNDSIILNSLSYMPRVLLNLSQYECVNLYLDNDRAGKEAAMKVVQNCKRTINYSELLYTDFKDFNDFLITRKG